ncbi:MAG: rod shape-determining protein MreD [Bacteroidetes bacterium]|nr:MAG: rod shape-determining protein MreD [Bacteroidota bacterium]
MLSEILRHAARLVLLVLAQGLILKNAEIGPYINPFLYILFIMQLPFETPPWLGLLLAFFTGLLVDLFYQTPGVHTTVCTFIGYLRPGILRLMSPREGYEFGFQPTMQYMGRSWFISYAAIMIVLHHLFLFFLEVLSFHEFFSTLLRVIASSGVTLLLVLVVQLLFYRRKEAA